MAEIITRKYKKGKLIDETRIEFDWEPNAADLDTETVECECGDKFEVPFDVLALFGFNGMHCGQCGKAGKMKLSEEPSCTQ